MVVWKNGPTEGQWRFREAIASRFGGPPDNILVIAGAQQGLDLLVRCLVDPGDSVIIERPGYLGAVHSFRNAGARLIGWDIRRADLDELEESLLRYRPKLMYLNPTHQNPTSLTMPLRARRELLELAERYRVPIVEDDTYRELTLGAAPPPSLYALDEMHTIVIHLNTFSKMLAPGLRLGWIAAVPPIVEQLSLIKQRVDLHPQNLSQLAVAALLENGVFDRHLHTLRQEHRRRRDAMVKALRPACPCWPLALRGARRRAVSVVPARRQGAGTRGPAAGDARGDGVRAGRGLLCGRRRHAGDAGLLHVTAAGTRHRGGALSRAQHRGGRTAAAVQASEVPVA